jgi:hypothetical protein
LGIEIDTAPGTKATGSSELPNELDNSAKADKLKTDPAASSSGVMTTAAAPWGDIVNQAGPRLTNPDAKNPEEISRQQVLGALSTAS